MRVSNSLIWWGDESLFARESLVCHNHGMKLHWGILFLALLEVTIVANLLILDLSVFSPRTERGKTVQVSSCSPACLTAINQAVKDTSRPPATPTTITIEKTVAGRPASVKEFFIPLGPGSTQNDQWEDITGAGAYIDTGSYANIQTVYFEVSMRIPTKNGTVYARLYDVTDKHPVWFSDVSTSSDTSTFVAAKIKLDQGNKQYRVQMKTTLKYPSTLDFARIKIITK